MSFCNHCMKNKFRYQSFPKSAREKKHEYYLVTEPQIRNKSYLKKNNVAKQCCKRAFLYIRQKGSYTLEAAVILPLITAFFVSILFFFRVLQIETQVQESLNYASRKVACEAGSISSEVALRASAEAYFRKELSPYKLPAQYVRGGNAGITLLQSDMSGCYVELRADYYIKLPIRFFTVKGISISQKSKNHKWIGDSKDGEEEDYVYVTENGTVYHCNRKCTYLDLSIHMSEMAKLKDVRNKSGHKYYACSKCAEKNPDLKIIYITDYGICYHSSLSCSELKRTVYLIPISETNGKGACSKCGNSHDE